MNRGIVVCIALLACTGEGMRQGPAITVATVDGLTTTTNTRAALTRVGTFRPGTVLQSIGGLDADEDHDATAMGSAWLLPDGFITLQRGANTLRRYDSAGTVVARFGSRGEGPDEFLSPVVRRLVGDTLELLDADRGTVRRIGADLTPRPGRRLPEISSRQVWPFAMVDSGMVALRIEVDTTGAMSGPAFRLPVLVMLSRASTGRWDTLIQYPGLMLYPERGNEGGQDYPAQRPVTFGPSPLVAMWQDQIAVVDNGSRSIEVYGTDGRLRVRSLADWPLRPVTDEMRETKIATDLHDIELWDAPPQAKELWIAQARGQRFADSVAPYDRILPTRDGALWLRENITPIDTVEQTWLGFGRDGQLVRRLVMPAKMQLLDVDRDHALVRRTDDDGIGYIELHRLEGGGR